MKNKTALYGYFGYDNLGDELILEKALEIFPEAVVFTHKKKVEYKTLPRFSILNLIFYKKLIFPGGNILQTKSSILSFYYYVILILLFKLKGGKVMLVNQGIGPVKGVVNNFMLKILLKTVDLISFRTNEDFQKYSGECRNAILGADTVFLNVQRSEYQNKALCGIIPKTRYINKNFYIPDKYDVIAISPEDYNFLKLNYSDFNIKKFYGLTFQQSINFLKNYSTIISMPLHGVILSYIAGVEKIFACVYDEKVLNFVKEAENEINILDEKILNEEKENINIKINRCSKLEDFSTRAYNGYFLK